VNEEWKGVVGVVVAGTAVTRWYGMVLHSRVITLDCHWVMF
jgi:hypothetical protein